jgi:hypothetical protein
MTDRWQRPRSAWRDDEQFCTFAEDLWPEDVELANQRGYDKGASSKLRYRYQGWMAALIVVAEARKESKT